MCVPLHLSFQLWLRSWEQWPLGKQSFSACTAAFLFTHQSHLPHPHLGMFHSSFPLTLQPACLCWCSKMVFFPMFLTREAPGEEEHMRLWTWLFFLFPALTTRTQCLWGQMPPLMPILRGTVLPKAKCWILWVGIGDHFPICFLVAKDPLVVLHTKVPVHPWALCRLRSAMPKALCGIWA